MKCPLEWNEQLGKYECPNCGKTCRKKVQIPCKAEIPSLPQRMVNVTKATARHIVSGMKHCTEEQKAERYRKCSSNPCGLFRKYGEGGICAHDSCGCYIRSHGKFMDKLSWAESECPEGFWDKIDENGV
jgi:hypothetical protein